jgi:predicted 3-demethylubiquinone-9 3-methyltransferase (glyoxalase superfamily)
MGQESMTIKGGPNEMLEHVGQISFTVPCDTQEEIVLKALYMQIKLSCR